MIFQHQLLAQGRWFELSLMEQLANIGSEIHRIIKAKNDQKKFDSAVIRALELFDLTIQDSRWKDRLKEILRVREIFCDIIYGDNQYNTSLEDLDKYFFYFALAAKKKKIIFLYISYCRYHYSFYSMQSIFCFIKYY